MYKKKNKDISRLAQLWNADCLLKNTPFKRGKYVANQGIKHLDSVTLTDHSIFIKYFFLQSTIHPRTSFSTGPTGL